MAACHCVTFWCEHRPDHSGRSQAIFMYLFPYLLHYNFCKILELGNGFIIMNLQDMVASYVTPKEGFIHNTLKPGHFSHVAIELQLFKALLSAKIVRCVLFPKTFLTMSAWGPSAGN